MDALGSGLLSGFGSRCGYGTWRLGADGLAPFSNDDGGADGSDWWDFGGGGGGRGDVDFAAHAANAPDGSRQAVTSSTGGRGATCPCMHG